MLLVARNYKPACVSLNTDIEIIGVKLMEPYDMYIFFVYRSTLFPVANFISALSDILASFTHNHVCVIGDMNENLLLDETTLIYNMFKQFGFAQHISELTRDSGSLIDHVYTLNIDGHINSKVQDCYYSDHDIVSCVLSI